jgi:hypothetical protein
MCENAWRFLRTGTAQDSTSAMAVIGKANRVRALWNFVILLAFSDFI